MSSRPSGSAEAAPPSSVTLRRSPRFDPYKASTTQRAQQRATPRSLNGTVDPSPFAVVPPVLVPKKKRKTSTTATTTTTATTSGDPVSRTNKAARRISSSLKENEAKVAHQTVVESSHLTSTKSQLEGVDATAISPIRTRSTRRSVAVVSKEQIESAPALRRLLKKKSQPATTEDEVLPRAIIVGAYLLVACDHKLMRISRNLSRQRNSLALQRKRRLPMLKTLPPSMAGLCARDTA